MKISKEKFIDFVTKYKNAFDEQAEFQAALRPFFESPICTYQSSLLNAYEELLVEVCGCEEEDGIFSWWLLESPADNKIITVKHYPTEDTTIYDATSVEGLYDYLYDTYSEEA